MNDEAARYDGSVEVQHLDGDGHRSTTRHKLFRNIIIIIIIIIDDRCTIDVIYHCIILHLSSFMRTVADLL